MPLVPMRALVGAVALAVSCLASRTAALAAGPTPWAIDFQPPASPVMEAITGLNIYLNVVVIGVVVLVSAVMLYIVIRFNARRNPTPATWAHHTRLEVVWTVIPVVILVSIAVPSFRLLYFEDRVRAADLTLKVVGHQWYWTYEYPDLGVALDANMVPDDALQPGQPRLLATDNTLVVPAGRDIRILISADDIIHSWAVPAFGIKTDAVPGRLNETWVRVNQPGTYYGYCAELCGIRHAFMPVAVEAVAAPEFDAWVQSHRKTARNGS